MDAKTPAIELKNITKTFGKVVANKDICLTVHRGEILSVLGENGSGKTTLMNMISGIYFPDHGQIFINGKEAVISSPKDAFDYKIFKYISIMFIIIWTGCMLILYHSVYLQNLDREESIYKQINENKKEIEYYDIPFYAVHNPNASTEFHQGTFKQYYGIEQDVKLKRITCNYKYNLIYEGEVE